MYIQKNFKSDHLLKSYYQIKCAILVTSLFAVFVSPSPAHCP